MSVSLRAAAQRELRRRGYTGRQQPLMPRFRAWAERRFPGFIWYPDAVLIGDVLEAMLHGDGPQAALITKPPRHGKTLQVSQLFPAYVLSHWAYWIGLASYNENLATKFSRKARDLCTTVGDKEAAGEWETTLDGGMWSAGIAGSITGRGGNILLLDDLIKDVMEAFSPVIQTRNQEWLDATLGSRLQSPTIPIPRPDWNMLVNIMTRWGVLDPASMLLNYWRQAAQPVTVLHFPALALPREELVEFYKDWPNITIVTDQRAVDEALNPKLFSFATLDARRRALNSGYWWNSLYQGIPSARGGGVFPMDQLRIIPAIPADETIVLRVRSWDKAGTKEEQATARSSRTAGMRLALGKSGRLYIEHAVVGRWEAMERENLIRTTAEVDGRKVHIVIEQEPGSGGKESAQTSVIKLARFIVHIDRPQGEKAVRAIPVATQWQAGNVFMVGEPNVGWMETVIQELRDYPAGLRDLVDAMGQGYAYLIDRTQKQGPPVAAKSSPLYPAFAVSP